MTSVVLGAAAACVVLSAGAMSAHAVFPSPTVQITSVCVNSAAQGQMYFSGNGPCRKGLTKYAVDDPLHRLPACYKNSNGLIRKVSGPGDCVLAPLSKKETFTEVPSLASDLYFCIVKANVPRPTGLTMFFVGTSPVKCKSGFFLGVVKQANRPPVADSQSVSLNEDSSVLITLTGSDPDGQPITFEIVSLAGHGQLFRGNSTAPADLISAPGVIPSLGGSALVTYKPSANYFGPDSFTFRTNDPFVPSPTATVSLTVNPVNDAPSFTKGPDVQVDEDAGPQTIAGWATSISAGPNESAQIVSFVMSNDNNALFASQPAISAAGTLSFTPAANVSGSATVSATIKDNGGTANGGVDTGPTVQFQITVLAVNDAPSFTKGADESVSEDAGAQSVVGWATAISPGGGADEALQTVTFQITGNTNPSLFSVAPALSNTGTLSYTPAADAFGTSTITVQAVDNGGTANGGVDTSAPQTFTITVLSVNDAPSFTLPASPDQSVLEDSGAATVAGFATGISAGPANESAQTVTFHVSNDNTALFSAQPAIDETTGDLTFTPTAATTGSAVVSVFLTDDGGTANGGVDTSGTQVFTIEVRPPNAAPVAASQIGGSAVSVTEDVTKQITLSATDDDDDALTFSIVTGPSHGTLGSIGLPDCSALNVCTATVDYTPALNYNGSDSFTFKANDGTVDSNVATVDITVAPVDDPPTDIALSNASIDENSATGSTVGTFSTTDVDVGDTHAYSLVSGAGSADNGSFQIVGGALKTNTSLDFETKSSYSIRVRSTDSGLLFFEKQFTISINDLNEAPTDISLSPASVDENQPTGTTVGTLTATDQDVGDTNTFTLVAGTGSDDNGSFQIVGNLLKTNATFDFEAKSSYSIRVRSTDSGSLSFEKQFTITINNVNEAPTDISLTANSIDENQPSGTTIGSLSATDPDIGQTHTFALANSGCSGSFPDNAAFSVSGSSLKSAIVFNFEVKSSYTICLRTTDSGTPQLSFDEQFTITVNDVNDPPVATPDSYTGAIGNTLAVVQTAGTGPNVALTGNVVINNDTDEDTTFPHTLSAVAETVTSTGGGTATINADGSFTFLPGVGDKNQDDTFTYHVTDGSATTAGTVTVHIDNFLVWYVDSSSAASTHDGRSSSPFLDLSSLNGAGGSGDSDGSGDIIFAYRGNSGTTPYGGGLPLEASQRLVGESAGLVVNGHSLVAAGPSPAVITNSGGVGVALANGVDIQGITISGASGDGVAGTSITTATIGTTTAVTISNSGADGIDLSGAASGNISVAATISGSAGHSVTVSNRSGGTVAFSGAITDTGTGISLSSNTGGTINFTGGVTVNSGVNGAFSATGGGTVNVTGSANTLTTTTGRALNVENTTIGASGLTFRSISSNGASNGIRLNSTGTSGGLTVTGTGSVGTGGTIQSSTDSGVSGNATRAPSLSWMTIQNNGNALNEGGIRLTEVTGTGQLVSSSVTGSYEDNVYVANSSVTLSGLSIHGPSCLIGNNNTSNGNAGVTVLSAGTSTMTVTVDNCSLSGNRSDAIHVDGGDSSTLTATITNNVITAGTTGNNQGNIGVDVSAANHAQLTFQVDNNKIGTPDGTTAASLLNTGISVFNGTLETSNPAGISGTVKNNVVINDNAAASGVSNGFGIRLFNQGYGTMAANVSGNTVSNVNTDYGIFVEVSSNSGQANSTGTTTVGVTNNTANVKSGALDAIRVQARGRSVMNARINGNTSSGGGSGGFFGLEIRQASQTISATTYQATFNLEGLTTGLQTDHTTIVNYLAGQNPTCATVDEIHSTGITGVVSVAGIPA